MQELFSKFYKKGLKFFDALIGGREYKKFVIITRSRTGSNLLISLLNSHPHIEAHGELFARLNGKSSRAIWAEIFVKKNRRISNVGFKIFYYHPADSEDRQVWDFIAADKDIRIIHLKRRNLLRTYLSRKIAGKTDVWLQKGASSKITKEDKKIILNPEECFRDFESTLKSEQETDSKYADHHMLEVYYEDLIASDQPLNDIQIFLNVPVRRLRSDLKKQNAENLKDIVANYDEIIEDFRNSKWNYLLEMEAD